jgi:hypothetical protein
MIGPFEPTADDATLVVLVVDEVVVDVVVDVVVVVPEDVAPPPLPALTPPEPTAAVEVVVARGLIDVVVDGARRFTTPENLRWPAWVTTFKVRTGSRRRPATDDAEASMLTIATRRLVETTSVTNFGIRCVVLERKKFFTVPLYMEYILTTSHHR